MNTPPPHLDPQLQTDEETARLLKAVCETRPAVPPLDEFTRVRILETARRARIQRRVLAPLSGAVAALLALILFSVPSLAPPPETREIAGPTPTVPPPAPFEEFDPVLVDLDLLDLELEEMMSWDWLTAANGIALPLSEPNSDEESI